MDSTVGHGYGITGGPAPLGPSFCGFRDGVVRRSIQDIMLSTEPASISSRQAGPFPDQLRLAVIAYLARFKGSSREHTESDLRCYLNWCAGHGLDPLAAQRPHLELYIRWMQETRRFKRVMFSRRAIAHSGRL